MKKTLKGFTLVELLVVIAIIGMLSTVAVVALSSARTKSRDAKRVADIKQIQTALELYFNDKGVYPAGAAIALGKDQTQLTGSGFATGATTYMGLIPRDPLMATGAAADTCSGADVAPCDYTYTVDGTTKYKLQFALEAITAGLPLGANCATKDGIKGEACPAAAP